MNVGNTKGQTAHFLQEKKTSTHKKEGGTCRLKDLRGRLAIHNICTFLNTPLNK